ncbi:MAG TPA: cytochrome c [Verrucomicrobiae bacterium]|nr:cytochrome c [Verrucomicrobiae bacterium]
MFLQNRASRLVLSAAIALGASLFLSDLASAGTPKGSETKGRAYYRQLCKDCHTKGAKAGEVSPLTKTQAQWRTYFQKGKHANGTEPLSKFMDDTKLLDVQTFLINHAADSPQPETCGK